MSRRWCALEASEVNRLDDRFAEPSMSMSVVTESLRGEDPVRSKARGALGLSVFARGIAGGARYVNFIFNLGIWVR